MASFLASSFAPPKSIFNTGATLILLKCKSGSHYYFGTNTMACVTLVICIPSTSLSSSLSTQPLLAPPSHTGCFGGPWLSWVYSASGLCSECSLPGQPRVPLLSAPQSLSPRGLPWPPLFKIADSPHSCCSYWLSLLHVSSLVLATLVCTISRQEFLSFFFLLFTAAFPVSNLCLAHSRVLIKIVEWNNGSMRNTTW